MIKTTLLSMGAALTLASIGQASVVTLSGSRTGPLVLTSSDGNAVAGGLIRLGTLSGAPASSSVDDINAVFQEFATGNTSGTGALGQTFNNAAASPFDGQQVYIWVFDTADGVNPAEHGVFTVQDPNNPGDGSPWVYPTHTGSGTDAVTLTLGALTGGSGDASITPGIEFTADNGGRLTLTPVPEPSGALLAGLAGMLIAFRRRR